MRCTALVLEFPRVALLVVKQTWVVVTLVEIFEDGGEHLGFFVGKGDSLALCLEATSAAGGLKERRLAEYFLVCCKESAISTNRQGDDRRGRRRGCGCRCGLLGNRILLIERSLQLRHFRVVPLGARSLVSRRLVDAAGVLRPKRALEHGCGSYGRKSVDKEWTRDGNFDGGGRVMTSQLMYRSTWLESDEKSVEIESKRERSQKSDAQQERLTNGPGRRNMSIKTRRYPLGEALRPFFRCVWGEEERRQSGVWGERPVFISTGRSSPAIHVRAANAAGFKDKMRQPAA